MRKTSLLVILLFSAFLSKAQFHIGLNTAVNGTFVLDKGLSEDPRYNSTMTYQFAPVGVTMGVNFGRRFGLQLESIMANQGQIYEVVDAAKNVVGERNIDLTYIQLPLLMKFMNGSNKGARSNFSIGPQLSLLSKGMETMQYDASIMEIPAQYVTDNGDGTFTIVDASTNQILTEAATLAEDGKYNVPALDPKELMNSKANDELQRFRNAEFQIAASFGLDIDLGKHLYLSSLIRANYSLTDMRNGDVIDMIKAEGVRSVFEKRANLLVGVQLGLNYVIGGTRSFKAKNP